MVDWSDDRIASLSDQDLKNLLVNAERKSATAIIAQCKADIAAADIVLCGMLFLEDHFLPILDDLRARRESCDAMICLASASEVTQLTRLGQFDMSKPASGPMALLKKLRGGSKDKPATGGAAQMKMLRRLPQLLRFIPGTAQDVRSYFITMQYWMGGSDVNVLNMVRHLIDRGAEGPRKALRGKVKVDPPIDYPEVGVYHPRMSGKFSDDSDALPMPVGVPVQGTVGVLMLRSYLLSGNCAHYDGVIASLEARGLRVIPAFAAGLDSRPAIDEFFIKNEQVCVDAVVSLSGFSLVGGPPTTTPMPRKRCWLNWMCPMLLHTLLNFRHLTSGAVQNAACCPLKTPSWWPFRSSMDLQVPLFLGVVQVRRV